MSKATTLEGRVVLVTGASAGIGTATAKRLAAAGASVGVTARRGDRLEGILAEIEAAGGRGCVAEADAASLESVQSAVARVREELGPIDVLVSNAGFGFGDGPGWMATSQTDEQWDTATGFGPFKKKERKHVIYLKEHIFTYDRAAKRPRALRTVNPIYEDLVRHMRGRSPKELQKSFMQAMRYAPTGEQRTVGEVGCTVSRSPTVGEVCLTADGILVEQRVLGQTQRLTALEMDTSGDTALYDPERWDLPIEEGPDVRKILSGLKDAIPEGR